MVGGVFCTSRTQQWIAVGRSRTCLPLVALNAALCFSGIVQHPLRPQHHSRGSWFKACLAISPSFLDFYACSVELTVEAKPRSSCYAEMLRRPVYYHQSTSSTVSIVLLLRLTAKNAMLVTTLLFSGFVTSLTRYRAYPFCCAGRPTPPMAPRLGGIVVAVEFDEAGCTGDSLFRW